MIAREPSKFNPTATTLDPSTENSIVAVIPAYNEERFIGSVVLKAKSLVSTVIVVDDGSSDRTAHLAAAAGAEVVQLSSNQGKGRALNAGFEEAFRYNPRAVVILDADSQHDPDELPALVAPILAGEADVVIGSRFLGTKNQIPRYRQWGQTVLTRMTNVASGLQVTDSQSGYRAFSMRALSRLNFGSQGLAVESEMQFLFKGSNLRIAEVPIHVHYLDKAKRNPIRHGLQVMDLILGLVARRRPLLFFSAPGIVLIMLGLLVGARVIATLDHTALLPIGTALITTILILAGILLGITGVILHSFDYVVTRMQEELGRMVPRAATDGRLDQALD
jgi:glycosyltransferase involved in cell wall biosynthesis